MGNEPSMVDDDGKRWGTLAEVAEAYGVSVDTIRRRMKRGELEARRQQTPQGFKWLAAMPEASPTKTAPDASESLRTNESASQGVTVIERDRDELVTMLRHELELRNREIARLHEVVAAQANAIAQTTAALPSSTFQASTDTQPSPTQPGQALTPAPESTSETEVSRSGETIWDRLRRWLTR